MLRSEATNEDSFFCVACTSCALTRTVCRTLTGAGICEQLLRYPVAAAVQCTAGRAEGLPGRRDQPDPRKLWCVHACVLQHVGDCRWCCAPLLAVDCALDDIIITRRESHPMHAVHS
jgi:hypothetical protein